MLSLIQNRRSDLHSICRSRAVRRLELFGSAVRADFNAESDLDFLVEFDTDSRAPVLDDYFGLKEDLESLFGRPVDLVMLRAVRNPYVRAGIERDRELLYAA